MIHQASDPVLLRLSGLRRQARQVLWFGGLARVALLLVGLVLIATLLDWWLHFDDPGVRCLWLLGIVSAVGWGAWRWWLAPLQSRLTDLDVALRIEQRHPELRDVLASSVQFVEQGGDPRVGSPELQRVVADQAAHRLQSLDLDDFIQSTPAVRAAIACAGLLSVAAILVLVSPHNAALALRRLCLPFHAPAWPRAVAWALLDGNLDPLPEDPAVPLQVPRGEIFRFHAVNSRGGLPQRVLLETRPLQSTAPPQVEPLRPLNLSENPQGLREVAVGQISPPKTALEFRVVGGDDSTMAWRTLKVVNPPIVEQLQVLVTPPPYTRRPTEKLPEGVGHITALVGSRVEIAARASRALERGTLRLRDRERLPLALAPDQRGVTGEFFIHEPGVTSWWFDLRDPEGISSSDLVRYEIRGIADLEPETVIEIPAADLQVTPQARVPVRIQSRDDLGLAEVRIVHDTNNGAETTVPLFRGESRPTELASEYTFELSALSLKEGDQVRFRSEALDDYVHPTDGTRHIKRSVVRVLTVVSPQDKTRELEQDQSELLHRLEQLARQQRQAQDQTRALELQLEKAGELRGQDLDALKRTELLQREVNSQLSNPAVGLAQKARETLAELQNNQIDDPQVERRLGAIAEQLEQLGEESLPEIEAELASARKSAEQPEGAEGNQETARQLAEARENQSEVLESLGEMQQELSEWRSERDLGRELNELASRQQQLQGKTGELQSKLLEEQAAGENSRQTEADLAQLAEQQRAAAEDLQDLEEKLQQQVQNQAGTEPTPAADALRETLEEARQAELAGKMEEAAANIEQKHLGEAARTQQDVLKKMQELSATLEQRRTRDDETLVKKMQQAAEQIESLSQRQQQLQDQLQQAGAMPDGAQKEEALQKLRQEQQKLQEETARLARLLQRSGAQRASESADRAQQRMADAEESLEQAPPEQAEDEMKEALDDLQQAEEELQEEIDEARERLAEELVEKSLGDLQLMIGRQQSAIDEAQRLDAAHTAAGKWSRSQNQSLKQLGELQRGLGLETESLAEKLAPAKVYALSLRGAARQMQKAAERVARKEVDAPTQALQMAARQRLADMVEAINARQQAEQQAQQQQQQQQQGENQENAGGPPQGEMVPTIAQFRILVNLQREMQARTAELDAQRTQPGRDWTDSDAAELRALQVDQDELADLARELSELLAEQDEPAAEDGETADAPDADDPDMIIGEPKQKRTEKPAEDEPGFLPEEKPGLLPGEKPAPQPDKPASPEDLPDVD